MTPEKEWGLLGFCRCVQTLPALIPGPFSLWEKGRN